MIQLPRIREFLVLLILAAVCTDSSASVGTSGPLGPAPSELLPTSPLPTLVFQMHYEFKDPENQYLGVVKQSVDSASVDSYLQIGIRELSSAFHIDPAAWKTKADAPQEEGYTFHAFGEALSEYSLTIDSRYASSLEAHLIEYAAAHGVDKDRHTFRLRLHVGVRVGIREFRDDKLLISSAVRIWLLKRHRYAPEENYREVGAFGLDKNGRRLQRGLQNSLLHAYADAFEGDPSLREELPE